MEWKSIRQAISEKESDFGDNDNVLGPLWPERTAPKEMRDWDGKPPLDWRSATVGMEIRPVEQQTDSIRPTKDTFDVLAEYHPSHSPCKINYHGRRIALSADRTLWDAVTTCRNATVGRILSLSRRTFRMCYSEFVRGHEIFHHLTERACWILGDGSRLHDAYLSDVYEPREHSRTGNLEEGLAEAFGAVLLKFSPASRFAWGEPVPFGNIPKEDYLDLLREIVHKAFLSSGRPPGYREGPRFVGEMELLLEPGLVKGSLLRLAGSSLPGRMKGMSWLHGELVSGNPHYFGDPSGPPSQPLSETQFRIVLENYRRYEPADSWFSGLLDWPMEELV
jgi:hypothetical protein